MVNSQARHTAPLHPRPLPAHRRNFTLVEDRYKACHRQLRFALDAGADQPPPNATACSLLASSRRRRSTLGRRPRQDVPAWWCSTLTVYEVRTGASQHGMRSLKSPRRRSGRQLVTAGWAEGHVKKLAEAQDLAQTPGCSPERFAHPSSFLFSRNKAEEDTLGFKKKHENEVGLCSNLP